MTCPTVLLVLCVEKQRHNGKKSTIIMEARKPLSSSSSSSAAAAAAVLHSDLVLELYSWNLLTPPLTAASPFPENDPRNDAIESLDCIHILIVLDIQRPLALNILISDKENIGETQIIVHDLDCTAITTTNGSDIGKNVDSKIVVSFTLNELNAQIIEFRDKQNRVMNFSGRKLYRSNANVSGNSTNCVVQMFGTLQNFDFYPTMTNLPRRWDTRTRMDH